MNRSTRLAILLAAVAFATSTVTCAVVGRQEARIQRLEARAAELEQEARTLRNAAEGAAMLDVLIQGRL